MSVWTSRQNPPTPEELDAWRVYRTTVPYHDAHAIDHWLAGRRSIRFEAKASVSCPSCKGSGGVEFVCTTCDGQGKLYKFEVKT